MDYWKEFYFDSTSSGSSSFDDYIAMQLAKEEMNKKRKSGKISQEKSHRSKHNKSLKKSKLCSKFKDCGIDNESLLPQSFARKIATGEKQRTPSEDVIELDKNDVGGDDLEDDGPENTVPGIGASNEHMDVTRSDDRVRKRSDVGGSSGSRKKRQSPIAILTNSLDRIISDWKCQNTEIIVKYYADTIKATIGDCIDKLGQLEEIIIGEDLYFFCIDLFETPSTRELFMGLRTDTIRVAWLKRRHHLYLTKERR